MRTLLLFAALLGGAVRALPAQVGHAPERSPYRTLRYAQFIGLNGGYFNGGGGQIGIAPHKGSLVGFRYDFLGATTLTLGLSASYGDTERYIVDAYKAIDNGGRTGPVKQSVVFTEGILQFNLTGGKSWHRIAPYVSAGMGLAWGSGVPADTSGFKFRVKFALTPGVGARVFLSDRLFLRLEARSTFWQLSYPQVYRSPPSADPTHAPAITGTSKEWVTNGWYQVGLAYAFHRPF